jgi:hypothetical protein
MNVRYVSQFHLEWNDLMKDSVERKIVNPLKHALHTDNFELSVHLGPERTRGRKRKQPHAGEAAGLELWLVLQMFDGRNNIVVRCQGEEFSELVGEMSFLMRAKLKSSQTQAPRRLFSLNPFWIAPVERTA